MARKQTVAEETPEPQPAVDVWDDHEEVVAKLVAVLGIRPERAERLAALSEEADGLELFEEPESVSVEHTAPVIGSSVHYHSDVKTYPAVVTAVSPDGVFCDLVVFGSPFGTYASRLRTLAGGPGKKNTWSWPPVVAAEPSEDGSTDQQAEEEQ